MGWVLLIVVSVSFAAICFKRPWIFSLAVFAIIAKLVGVLPVLALIAIVVVMLVIDEWQAAKKQRAFMSRVAEHHLNPP